MKITIDNGWQGPLPGIASHAALSVNADGAATLAIMRHDILTPPRAGRRFQVGEETFEVEARAEAPSGTLAFICKRITTDNA